jgi:hypothetical protein
VERPREMIDLKEKEIMLHYKGSKIAKDLIDLSTANSYLYCS